MVKEIYDSFEFMDEKEENKRYVTYEYENTEADREIIALINNLLNEKQKRCFNCTHFKKDGCFGGYNACSCEIYGVLETVGNQHYDMDGSKCKEYIRNVV